MYSNKENVNILTALLVAHGVRHAVVCPGSRNSPIVHNLNECPDIMCYPVTDERSAGFYALGMSQALNESVVVCVTSGTALLNLAPAVAEAYYQHRPLVVISADRPPQWIDQLDGQTLPQPDALGRFVRKAVSLPEPHDETSRWYCNRLVNEALIIADSPVHINVPISEPLFEFTAKSLPQERKIELLPMEFSKDVGEAIAARIARAQRPMVVIGQLKKGIFNEVDINYLCSGGLCIVCESMTADFCATNIDETVYMIGDDESYSPDFVLYIGGTLVSKRLKAFLRKSDAESWMVNADGSVQDVFGHLTKVILCSEEMLNKVIPYVEISPAFQHKWMEVVSRVVSHFKEYAPEYSQMATVKCFEGMLDTAPFGAVPPLYDASFHYANSTAIRLANIYAKHYVYCNRGVNGIDGSLSTAAGFSVVSEEKVFCVTGDLSFFYDSNALWNQNLKGNFRILLLNNGRGGIFNMLKGLDQSPARDKFVSAEHHTTAEGICQQNDVVYLSAHNMTEMQQGIDTLLNTESQRPVLLEVFTDASEDERVFKDYYHSLRI